MKSFLLPLCSVLALSLTFTACKKDKKEDPKPASKTELLSNKNWKITAITVDPALSYNGAMVTNLYAQSALFPDCSKDNLYRFEGSSVYKEDEAGTKCASTDTQTRVGTWSLSVDEKSLNTALPATTNPQEPAENATYSLLEVSDNTWRATTVTNFGTTTDYTLTITFTKQ